MKQGWQFPYLSFFCAAGVPVNLLSISWNWWLSSSEQEALSAELLLAHTNKRENFCHVSQCFGTHLWCSQKLPAPFRPEILTAATKFLANKLNAFILNQKQQSCGKSPSHTPEPVATVALWVARSRHIQLYRISVAFKIYNVKVTGVNLR